MTTLTSARRSPGAMPFSRSASGSPLLTSHSTPTNDSAPPQPLQRMRPPAQKTYIHQQHREWNQRGNHRHIDHTRATGKSAIQHHIEQRKTAAADDEQPPRPRLQLWPVGANLAAGQQRKQRRCQQPALKRERIRRQPRLAELAGNIAGRPKKRREKKHHIRMRQTVGLEKFRGIRKK